MDRLLASQLCREELNKYGLNDWGVRQTTDPNQAFLGLCSYKDKVIILNAHHIDIHPDVEVINTIRHEVAHALCPRHDHDEVWAAKAREIGCDNTFPCSNLSLTPAIIDAIRSDATVEVDFDEEIIRRPKYKITRLQDRCPDCGKVAIERFSVNTVNKTGDTVKLITLDCFHIITKVFQRGTPFETLVSNGWKEEIKNCKHDWDKNKCNNCGEFRLFDFQVKSAAFVEMALAAQKGAGVFHEMGLGKTVCALAYIHFHAKKVCPVLYVVKSGIKFQWFKEIFRWLGPDFLPMVITTSKDYVFPGLKSYIISYDLLRVFPREKLEKLGIKLVVMDECQQIKNADSGRTQAVRKLVGNPEIKVIPLSGTPWKNRGSEFFPVLNMMDPIKFHSNQAFLDNWVQYYWEGSSRKEGGIRNPEKFKEFIKDIVIRFERTEVMKELPLVNRMKLHVQLDSIQQDTYDEEESDFVKWYNDKVLGGEENLDGLELLAKMARMRHITGLAKVPATEEFVEEFVEETDRKLVIFVHHQDVGRILLNNLTEKYGNIMPVMKLTGAMSAEERFEVQEKFNQSPRALLIASTLAAGEGLNLQTGADCVMHERQWNPANEEQAEGRFIRIGQTSSFVNGSYAQAEGTIDEHLDGIVERKRNQFHNAMNKGQASSWNEAAIGKELAQNIVANFNKKQREREKTGKTNITAKASIRPKQPKPLMVGM